MIITRSPLRISLGGGGTDLPSYYREHGGFLIAGAIQRHVYVAVHKSFREDMLIRYSRNEVVKHRRDIEHPLIREALELLDIQDVNIEITTMADIPAGTGLGSSGAFCTALLKALYRYARKTIGSRTLAETACHIEIERLGDPVGKQDQYVAAFGGVNCYQFRPDDTVEVSPLQISEETLRHFCEHVLLFSTGITRAATMILRDQDQKTKLRDQGMIDNLHFTKEIGLQSKRALELGDLEAYGRLLHEHWEHKKKRSPGMSTEAVDQLYNIARDAGATGGKLIGAGGGGFLLVHAPDPVRVRRAMEAEGRMELRYNFDYEGTKIL